MTRQGPRTGQDLQTRQDLEQIHGIARATRERLEGDHGIRTVADLAALSDAALDELQRSMRAARIRRADVRRWRDEAREILSASTDGDPVDAAAGTDLVGIPDIPVATAPVADKPARVPGDEDTDALSPPRATFIVETRAPDPARAAGTATTFEVQHHETDEWSGPLDTVDEVASWIRARVGPEPPVAPVPDAPATTSDGAQPAPSPEPQPQPRRRGRFTITHLGLRTGDAGLATEADVAPGSPLLFDGSKPVVPICQVELQDTDRPATCRLRGWFRSRDTPFSQDLSWTQEPAVARGQRVDVVGAPLAIPPGTYRVEVLAEDPDRHVRRGFADLPVVVIE